MELSVARNRVHGTVPRSDATPELNHWRGIERIRAKPAGLLPGLAFRLKLLMPEDLAGINIHGIESIRRARHYDDVLVTLGGQNVFDHHRSGEGVHLSELAVNVNFPDDLHGF